MDKQKKSQDLSPGGNADSTTKMLDKRYEELILNETKYGVVMAIRTFGSLNIKTLARIMGKAESTIFHHVSELLKKPKIIEIDMEKTESKRGKFFKLTEETINRYKEDVDHVFEEKIPTILNDVMNLSPEKFLEQQINDLRDRDYLGTIAKSARRRLSYHHNIENFILNNFERTEEALKKGLIPKRKNFPFGTFNLLYLDMKISSLKHTFQLAQLTAEYFKKLNQLKNEIKSEMDTNNVKEEDRIAVHLHLFGGELAEFEFEEKFG
ncbi:MAG: hypothetical protein ACFFCZ_15635 [Promethearchaeota archaeon]